MDPVNLSQPISFAKKSPSIWKDEYIDQEVYEIIEFSFNCFFINIFAFIGLLCTTMNIVILSSHNITTDSSNILLMSLSVADFLFCLTLFISEMICILTHALDPLTALRVDLNFFHTCSLISKLFYITSITMGGAIAVERSIVVFFPLKTAGLITPFRTKCVSLAVYVINFALFSPALFCFKRELIYDERDATLTVVRTPTEFYLNHYEAISFVFGVVYCNLVGGTATILTLTLTPALAVRLLSALQQRSILTKRSHTFNPQTVKIIVTLCAVNLLFYSPFAFFNAAVYFMPSYFTMTNTYQLFILIADLSGTLCASVNFLVYVTLSPKFRKRYQALMKYNCFLKNKSV